jgi:hypothetical protein
VVDVNPPRLLVVDDDRTVLCEVLWNEPLVTAWDELPPTVELVVALVAVPVVALPPTDEPTLVLMLVLSDVLVP